MSNISKTIFDSGLMSEILKDLSPEEVADLELYIDEFIKPFDDFSLLMEDMMSTESTKEKLAEDIIKIFTAEGIEELEKCLEKS